MTSELCRGACPHDCPDTCAMLVTVDDGAAPASRATPTTRSPRGPVPEGARLRAPHEQPRPDPPSDAPRGAKGRGPLRARSPGTPRSTRSPTRFRAITASTARRRSCPYSYLGPSGCSTASTVGDPFFHRVGATVSERTFCDSGSSTAYFMTVGPDGGHRPRELRALPVHRHLGLQHHVHEHPHVEVRAEAQARREGRRHRPDAPPDGQARRLAHPHPPGDGRRAGARDGARHRPRRPRRRGLRARPHRRLRRAGRAARRVPAGARRGDHRRPGGGHRAPRPGVRDVAAGGDPRRRRRRAPRDRRPGGARHHVAARADRRLAARRRRHPAALALGVPPERGRDARARTGSSPGPGS